MVGAFDEEELAVVVPDARDEGGERARELVEEPNDKPLVVDAITETRRAGEARGDAARAPLRGDDLETESIALPDVSLQERREVRRARHPACLQRLQHVVVRVAGTGTTRKRAEHLVRDAIGLHRGARARAETRGGVRGARHRASAKRPHDGTEARARRRTTKCGVANRAKVAGSRISVRSLVYFYLR